MIVFLIPSISLEKESLESFPNFSLWVLEKVLSWGACFLVWWWSAYLITKNGTKVISIFSIWLIGFLGGLFGCLVGEILKNWLQLSFRLNFYQRTIYTSISCICVVMVTSVLGRDRRSFLFFKNEVKRSLIRERILSIRKSKIYSARFEKLHQEITSNLISIVEKNTNQGKFSELGIDLRSFSHKLFQGLNKKEVREPRTSKFFFSDVSFRLLMMSIRDEPLNPNIFTLVIGFFVSMPLLRLENSMKSLEASFIAIFTTFVIHNLQYRNWKLKRPSQLKVLLGFDFFNVIILIIEFSILKRYFGYYSEVSNPLFLYAMLVVLYSFFFVFGHLSRVSDVARLNEEQVKAIEANNAPTLNDLVEIEEFRIRLEWSKFVHAELQPYLLAMDLSTNPPSPDFQVSEIRSKVLNFRDSFVLFADPEVITFEDCFTSLISKWEGILTVIPDTGSIPITSVIQSQAILDLRDVLSELAVNAVKHGGADILRVQVKVGKSNSLVVRAENNGAPLGKVKAGLGLQVFDLLCGNNWSLRNYGGMVVFRCRIYNH